MRRVIVTCVALLVIGVVVGALVYWRNASENAARNLRSDKGSAVKVVGKSRKMSSSVAVPPGLTASTGRGIGVFSPDNEYEYGELLVSNPPATFAETVSALDFSVIEKVRLETLGLDVWRLAIPSGMSVPQARKMLRAQFSGLTIDANHDFEAQGVADYQQNIPRALIGWRKATANCGAGVRLGMIDASVDINHPALRGQRIKYRSFNRRDRRPGPADHGTAVAGILIGKPEWGGLLPGAELFAANMFEVTKTGRVVGDSMALIKALDWMAQERVQVVNMSIAGPDNKIVREVLDRARAKGLIMIVAAAGNWGRKGNPPAYPAAYKNIIAVTAFGAGKKLYSDANIGNYVDFAAPGVRVYTAVPGGGRIQTGTSFAAPFVSALVALKMESVALPGVDEMRKFLRGFSIDLGTKGKDKMFGWGFVNLQPKCS